jgi:hypothetical protein
VLASVGTEEHKEPSLIDDKDSDNDMEYFYVDNFIPEVKVTKSGSSRQNAKCGVMKNVQV